MQPEERDAAYLSCNPRLSTAGPSRPGCPLWSTLSAPLSPLARLCVLCAFAVHHPPHPLPVIRV